MLIDFCPWIADIVPSAITKLTIHAVAKKYSCCVSPADSQFCIFGTSAISLEKW